MTEHPGRVHLERLPAYSPELKPTELCGISSNSD
ncbi:hypothetical protein [Spirosoma profusum]